jgi:uncharacterized protein YegL
LNHIPTKYENEGRKLLSALFDAFEDRRVQSNYGTLYQGALERFADARQVDAKKKWSPNDEEIVPPTDPITAIQMASLDQHEAVANSDFKEAEDWIKLVEHTGKRGGIMLTQKFWREVGEKWILDYIKQIEEREQEEQKQQEEQEQKEKEEQAENLMDMFDPKQESPNGEPQEGDGEDEQDEDGESDGGQSGDGEQSPNEQKKDQEEQEDGQDEQSPQGQQDEQSGDGKPNSTDMEQQLKDACNDMSDGLPNDHEEFQEEEELGLNDVGDSLEAELNAGEEEVNDIEKALAEIKTKEEPPEFEYSDFSGGIAERDTYKEGEYEINVMVARQLSRMFRKIKGMDDYEVDMYGSEIDVDAYINRQIQGFGEFLKTEKNTTGFDIVIGVDESGSMDGHKIQIVRDMVATLYKALEMTPQVNLKVVGWQSNYRSCEIHEVTKIEQVRNIVAGGGTPLAKGTWHCKKVLEEMSGRKKVFFQITDGAPNDDNDIPRSKVAVQQMKKNGIMCFGILIGGSGGYTEGNMKTIFGKEFYLNCETIEDVSNFLTKTLSRKIATHLTRAC